MEGEGQSTWTRCAVLETRTLSLIVLILQYMTAITLKMLELDVRVCTMSMMYDSNVFSCYNNVLKFC